MIRAPLRVALPIALAAAAAPAEAQDFSLNSDALASFEEPLATEIGGVTVLLTGLLDGRLGFDLDGGGDDVDPGFTGNFEISAATQLGNRWNVGIAYFGQYESDPGSILDFGGRPGSGHYSDNIAGFVGGSWGTLVGGEVAGVVREETRRPRGAGNAALAFDDAYGRLERWGGGYTGRFGPARLGAIVDEDGNFDIGFTWSRPLGNKDYRFALRYTDAVFVAEDGMTRFDTRALTANVDLTYANTNISAGLGYERLDGDAIAADRWFASAGWQAKTGALTLSLEGHYGEVEGQSEFAAAAGARYDIARGMSLNLGLNHVDTQVMVGGVMLVDRDDTQATASLRYSF